MAEKYVGNASLTELVKKVKAELNTKLDKTATADFPKIQYGTQVPETLEDGTVFFVYM